MSAALSIRADALNAGRMPALPALGRASMDSDLTFALSFELRVQRYLCVEEARDGAARLGVVGGGLEGGLVPAWDARGHVEVDFGDAKARVRLFERDGGGRVYALGRHAGVAELLRERHREAARVRGRD